MRFQPSAESYGDSDRRDAYYTREALTTYAPTNIYGDAGQTLSTLAQIGSSVASIFQSKQQKKAAEAEAAAALQAAQTFEQQQNRQLELELLKAAEFRKNLMMGGAALLLLGTLAVGGVVAVRRMR